MNLLQEDWITIRRRSGWVEKISPMRLTANQDDPAVEVEAPRADFRGAICQFLVGLLQTTMAPADERAWRGLWDSPPGQDVLSSALESFLPAFELESAGPAFMQDFDLPMADPVGIAALLIDAPGEKTIGENKDHFVHRCSVRGLCEGCAAVALFTLQINAPSGGQGNRVSVRGGGPLTTLLLPVEAGATLWRKLWLNVLPETALGYPVTNDRALVLPWLGKTRTSEPGGVGDTTPDLAHPMQAYWSMPRRIRLDFAAVDAGVCDLCGLRTERLLRRYRAKNYGVNYMGAWLHPLSPYNYDARGEKPPLAVKGQRGGIGYRHWLGLTLGANERVPDAALVVKRYMRQRRTLPLGAEQARLWCFGYDLDNMKARCWYDSILPVYGFESDEQRERFAGTVTDLLAVADEMAQTLNQSVKQAWFKHPKDRGGEPAVSQSFWQRTETDFYRCLQQLAQADLSGEEVLPPIYRAWLGTVESSAVQLFDEWVLAASVEEKNVARVVKARTNLLRQLRGKGEAKRMREWIKQFEEVEA